MRILTVGNMYPPHHLGGYELMWRSAVLHLREWGHRVRVLTTDYQAAGVEPESEEDDGVARELGWYWHEHSFPKLGLRERVALERRNGATLGRHLGEFRPDVVSWWAMGGMSLSLIERCRAAGIPAAGTVVDDWPLYAAEVDAWSRTARRAGLLAPLLGRATGVPIPGRLADAGIWLFASQTLRRRAAAEGFDPPRALVAHPGIDHELFGGPRNGDSDWTWKLLYCGRIDERKGTDIAIEALALLPEQATLRVVGGGDEAHLVALRSLAADLGVERRVSFERRPRSELPATYEEADATLFPVRWEEPFGLVPLESMAMGTPVVASGRGGSGEYLRHAENCLLFEVERGADRLAGAIRRLADDPELRSRVRAGGLETAARFRTETFDRAVERCLLEAVTSPGRAAPAG